MTQTRDLNKETSLSEWDAFVLRLLSRQEYRFLTARHLAGLTQTPESDCEERLTSFVEVRLLSRLYTPDIRKQTPQEAIYTLARKGALRLANLTGEAPATMYAQLRPSSYLFLAHQLAISDFRYSLAMAIRSHRGVKLLGWRNDWDLRRDHGRAYRVKNPVAAGATIPVIPDAAFGFEIDNWRDYYFLEIDRGTMGLAAMRKKFLGYIQFFREGLHRSAFGFPHFRVLVVTTTAYRRQRFADLVKETGYTPNMFLFTTYEEKDNKGRTVTNISPAGILGDIWRKCNDHELHSLLD